MTHAHGTHLGGVRTLEDLRQRCFVDEMTDCWHWRGAKSAGVTRVWCFNPDRGEPTTMTGQRAAWVLGGGGPIKGKTVYHAQCTSTDCVNREHLACGTKAEAGAALTALGHLRDNPARSIANKRNGRSRSKFTPELRQYILESTEPAVHLAPRIGLSNATVSYIRQGKRWRDGIAGSSVFVQKAA